MKTKCTIGENLGANKLDADLKKRKIIIYIISGKYKIHYPCNIDI
jgi:hypothetical protein